MNSIGYQRLHNRTGQLSREWLAFVVADGGGPRYSTSWMETETGHKGQFYEGQ